MWVQRLTGLLGAWVLTAALLICPGASAEPTRLDLNHASVAQLCELPGIGQKRATAIVDRRKKHPFTRISQLLEVKGIGRKTLAKLRPLLFIGKPGQLRAMRPHPLVQGAPDASPTSPEG